MTLDFCKFKETAKINADCAAEVLAAVLKGFSVARRRALQTQGVVTMQQVRTNQATMKSVP